MKRKRLGTVAAALVVAGGAAYAIWLNSNSNDVPEGFARSNGRIEAERVDIATKFAGRLEKVLVKEGDRVKAGDILAQLDAAELNAQLAEANAGVTQSEQQLGQANALLAQRESELVFAKKELERFESLVNKGFTTAEKVDQLKMSLATAKATVSAAQAQVALTQAGIKASTATVERLQIYLKDMTLTAPRDGRVQYRLAEPGEVLAAGGKVLTLVDLTDVYMTIFLPARHVGPLSVGSDARIILDPIPQYTIPAKVTFVASQAQYTPKSVETDEERDKLLFRVKLTIAPELLRKYEREAKAGVRGIGYVRVSADIVWPETLAVKLP